jgi:hypothetical protein
MTAHGCDAAREAGDTASVTAVAPTVLRMTWWREWLFGLLLRLDTQSGTVEGVPADRVHIVDLPIEL